jgi:hypothetical protein
MRRSRNMKRVPIVLRSAVVSWLLGVCACGEDLEAANESTDLRAEALTLESQDALDEQAKKKKKDPPSKPPPCACVCAGTTGSKWSCQPTACSPKDGTSCSAAFDEPLEPSGAL